MHSVGWTRTPFAQENGWSRLLASSSIMLGRGQADVEFRGFSWKKAARRDAMLHVGVGRESFALKADSYLR